MCKLQCQLATSCISLSCFSKHLINIYLTAIQFQCITDQYGISLKKITYFPVNQLNVTTSLKKTMSYDTYILYISRCRYVKWLHT